MSAGGRCPRCQATNPEGAAWCGQCYERLAPPVPAPDREPEPVVQDAPAASATAGGFRTSGGEVEWSCVACGLYNTLEAATCRACGTPLRARFDEAGEPGRRQPDWRAALGLSVLLPGAGHVLAGRAPSGVARALLFVVWLAGGVLVAGGGAAALAAVPLLLGALVLWAGSLLDVAGLARGGPELLTSRTLLWLVVGVTMLSVTGLVAGFVSLT